MINPPYLLFIGGVFEPPLQKETPKKRDDKGPGKQRLPPPKVFSCSIPFWKAFSTWAFPHECLWRF
jgi:hypothetical protein